MGRGAEKVLAILMDDKKYNARIKELKAQEASLANVLQIAATIQAADTMLQKAGRLQAEVTAEKKAIVEREQAKIKEMADQLRAQQLIADERLAKELVRYKDIDKRLIEVQNLESATNKLLSKLQLEQQQLESWDRDLNTREAVLRAKLAKLAEIMGDK